MNTRQSAMPENQKITALYERLSSEDERENESLSIENQKKALEKYAQRNGFKNIKHFTDDGVSGTRFDRPGLNEMLREIEAGKVGTVIVKDMSRAGRDYLRVGLFMETLRENDVRLIATEDGVDSLKGYDDFIPFRNIINEWAARDASRKITAVMKAKGLEGKRLTSSPIFGYAYDESKENWIIDEESAVTIRRIYQLTIEGHGPTTIARMLHDEKTVRPAYRLAQLKIGKIRSCFYSESNKYIWSSTVVAEIISKPEYRGATVNFRFYKESYKDKNARKNPEENWMIFENTHPAIVDSETWETAQRCRKVLRRTDTLGVANPLTGKLFCADCGAKMYNHRRKGGKPCFTNPRTGKTYKRSPADSYICSAHTNAQQRFTPTCTAHTINTRAVRAIILDTIKAASVFVKTSEAEFVKQIREASEVKQEETAKAYKDRLSKAQRRASELNGLFRKIYEDNASKKLSDKRFELLSAEYEKEQEELENTITEIQTALDNFTKDSTRADKFIELVQKYTDFSELTTPMINEFVEKILVHEADKSSGERIQDVEVYLNFIGKFEIPPQELTEEEEQEQVLIKQRRKHQKSYRERLKLKKQQQNTEHGA